MRRRAPVEMLAALGAGAMRFDLAPFRALLAALEHPERKLATVLVAGTNGKGSTAALLDSVARAAGLRVGLATSPHLVAVEERISIDGTAIGADELADLLVRVLAAAETAGGGDPTYFEATIAASFLAFAAARVDLAVVEVGLGGRLDATNAAEPILAVVTPIQLDHRELLGSTLAEIAREKAGIFRRAVPVVVAAQAPEARHELARQAAHLDCFLCDASRAVVVERAAWLGFAGHDVRLRSPRASYDFRLPLAGEHQIDNAATAICSAELLAARFPAIDRSAIVAGIARTRWPGRLETIALADGATTVLLDAAHNPDGCVALARFLDRLGRPFDLLFGALADKEVERMLPPLAARARRVTLTRPGSSRALAPELLARRLDEPSRVDVVEDPARALEAALAARPSLLVVCGSLYLVGALRDGLRRRGGALDLR